MDKNLSDDQLKLVRFKILFVKRGFEHAFREQEALIWDNSDSMAFTAWKIADFIQSLAHKTTRVPAAWGHSYPPENDPAYREHGILLGFPEQDKKYLRVYYEVLERYTREKFRFEERQIEVLEDIRDRLCQKHFLSHSAGAMPPAETSIAPRGAGKIAVHRTWQIG